VVMIPTVVNCAKHYQNPFVHLPTVRLSVCFAEFPSFCNVKPDAEWVPYTIAVPSFSLFAFLCHAHPLVSNPM
jgi:hypothetical protein